MLSKSELWRAALAEVDSLSDGLGSEIDPGIREIVAALRMHGFPTSQSCEGHLERGLPYPWVEVYASPPEGLQERKEAVTEWTRANLRERGRLQGLLSEFYRERQVPYGVTLAFRWIGGYGAFRLQCIGSELVTTLSAEEQVMTLRSYREEMQALTEFLKDRTPSP